MDVTNEGKIRLSVSPAASFLAPYIEQAFQPCSLVTDAEDPDVKVRILSNHEIKIVSPSTSCVLSVPYVIGTGMTGPVMRLAKLVKSGLYMRPRHKEAQPEGHRTLSGLGSKALKINNDSSLSNHEKVIPVVHAIDVAKAVKLLSDKEGKHYITDGSETTVDGLAGALAVRLNDKRIPEFPAFLARLASRFFSVSFPTVNLDGEEINGWEKINVVSYLKTHQYGAEDI